MQTSSRVRVRSVRPLGGEPQRSLAAVSQVLGAGSTDSFVPWLTAQHGQPATVSPAEASARPPRRAWMDVLRGSAIILVVTTHVLAQGWRLHGIEETPLNVLAWTVAPVRIPLLILLSGMLLSRSLAKGPRLFVAGKLRGIAWPYVLWSLIYFGVWQVAPTIDGGQHRPPGASDILLTPVSVLWYLHLLLGLYLLALILLSVPRVRPWQLVTGLGAIWVVSSFGDLPHVERAACLATFFLAGDLVARRLDHGVPGAILTLWSTPARRLATVAAHLVLAAPLAYWAVVVTQARYAPYSVVPVVATMVLFVLAARALSGTKVEVALAWVGRQSLIFYVAHWLLVGAFYALLALVADPAQHPYVAVALVLSSTLAACSVLARLSQVWAPAGWLFAAPRRRSLDRARTQG